MKVPKAITKALSDDRLSVVHIGTYDGCDAFEAYIPDGVTGFPFVYLCKGEEVVKRLDGHEALDVVVKLVKED